MTRYRALIADDEALARETVRSLLAIDGEVEVVGECRDGASALEAIREARPHIVFLDIEMPGLSGLEVLAEIVGEEPKALDRPVVVYLTAYNEFAIEAFGLEALDYLLKPFSDDRFYESLERAKRRVRESSSAPGLHDEPSLAELQAGSQPTPYVQRISVKRGGRLILVPTDRIRFIESEDYYARIHAGCGSYLLRESLASLERRLDPMLFRRVHRTAIVRREVVSEIETLPAGGKLLVLDDETEIRVSRSRAREVESWLRGIG